LHAYDKDKLSNLIGKDVSPEDFSVRKGKDNESLICLDGKEYDLNDNITVITCCDKPVAIAGVIGGLETSVSSTTSSIYLEGAVFNPVTIRKSSKAAGIRTESSSRYEKGISSKNTISAVTRAINLLEEYFSIHSPIINTSNLFSNEDIFIKLRRNRIHKILGPLIINHQFEKRNLSDNEIVDKLTLIGCTLKNKEYGWDVAVIPNRSHDLIREIDLIEEIARLIGYDRFDLKLPNPIKPGKLSSEQLALRKVKNGFTENGFNEVLSYSLVPEDNEKLIKISNPLLLETSCLRDNIWKEHLEIVNRNIKAGQASCYIFEIGNVFQKKTEFIQEEVLNGEIYGNKKFGEWINSGNDNDLNYFQARGKLEAALSSLNIKIEDKPTDSIDYLHPGRTAKLVIEGKDAGYFGEIHPKLILKKQSLKKVYLFSINVSNLLGASTRKNKWIPIFKKYPIVPKMERDINFVFSKKFLISEITSQIRKTGKNLLEDVSLLDVFEDTKFGDDHVSYTFRLSYRDKDKTLLDSDIKSLHSSIISNIEKSFNTKLRN